MHYLFLVFSVICLIVGIPNLFAYTLYGIAMTIAGVLFYLLFRALNNGGIISVFDDTPLFQLFRTPAEVYEAACLLNDHRSGRNLGAGGEVFITDDVWASDYSVQLNAKTLLDSNDPSIKVHDLRSNG